MRIDASWVYKIIFYANKRIESCWLIQLEHELKKKACQSI